MSTAAASPITSNSTGTKPKKKNKKKKTGTAKAENKDESQSANGTADGPNEDEGDEADDAAGDDNLIAPVSEESEESSKPQDRPDQSADSLNGDNHTSDTSPKANGLAVRSDPMTSNGSTEEKLNALAKERDELKAEVTQLRQSLESITGQHEEDLSSLKEELEQSRGEKDHAETQYQNLLGRVNQIRSQLEGRLRSDAAELAQTRSQIEELEEQNRHLQEAQDETATDMAQLQAENKRQAQDIDDLRSRTNLSQSNWVKEREDLALRESQAREQFQEARQAMQDWEVLAMEERSQREHLTDRIADLEEQVINHKESYERAAGERDSQAQTVDGLQRALRDIQDARKKELRELVEQSQSQLEELRKQLQAAEEAASIAQAELDTTRKELERAAPFEEQVREKNLAIGKLRHEAVTLREHLTKALRFLKQRKPEETVDRQLVTNHFLHFIALDRADPKKFQILQLIAALLGWTDEQKEQAGLARPGAVLPAPGSLRLPQSPFRRTPSTPQLGGDPMAFEPSGAVTKESLAELWSDFLEREAEEGRPGISSRKSSAATVPPVVSSSRSPPPSGLGLQ